MASIIISGNTMEEVPELNKMINDLIKGKIGITQFIKFLNDNDLETKVSCINKDIEPSVLDDFVGDTLCNIFCYKKSEHEDTENYIEDEENNEEKVEDDEFKIPDEFWKKTNKAYEKHVKDTIDFAKRLVDDYGDSREDDIDHTKAVKLFHSLIVLARTYRQRASGGDERYNIPNFSPENILKFIESLDLPTDKIKAASERGKSTHYKMKIYKSFEEFEKNMKDAYGIEDVWNPPKEIPDWFETVRDNMYRKFHNDEILKAIDEDEWNEFKNWKENKDKGIYVKTDKILKDILKIKPNISLHEMLDIGNRVEKEFKEYLESLKNSKDSADSLKKESFENQCRCIVNDIINKFSPILTGEALKYFENKYKTNDKLFMNQLKSLYNAVKSAKNDGLICYIDVNAGTIICNPIPNTKKDIEEIVIDTLSKSDSKESSTKKSSTSKKTTASASAKSDKTSTKKASKTDMGTKEFKKYADYILLNSTAEDDARDLLLSYAANMDERCKKLYDRLVEFKKNNETVKLIKYVDGKTGKEDIDFE